ncbi:MAG: hypothetical protein ACXWYM_00375 [Candidatus Binatia bacterium]
MKRGDPKLTQFREDMDLLAESHKDDPDERKNILQIKDVFIREITMAPCKPRPDRKKK